MNAEELKTMQENQKKLQEIGRTVQNLGKKLISLFDPPLAPNEIEDLQKTAEDEAAKEKPLNEIMDDLKKAFDDAKTNKDDLDNIKIPELVDISAEDNYLKKIDDFNTNFGNIFIFLSVPFDKTSADCIFNEVDTQKFTRYCNNSIEHGISPNQKYKADLILKNLNAINHEFNTLINKTSLIANNILTYYFKFFYTQNFITYDIIEGLKNNVTTISANLTNLIARNLFFFENISEAFSDITKLKGIDIEDLVTLLQNINNYLLNKTVINIEIIKKINNLPKTQLKNIFDETKFKKIIDTLQKEYRLLFDRITTFLNDIPPSDLRNILNELLTNITNQIFTNKNNQENFFNDFKTRIQIDKQKEFITDCYEQINKITIKSKNIQNIAGIIERIISSINLVKKIVKIVYYNSDDSPVQLNTNILQQKFIEELTIFHIQKIIKIRDQLKTTTPIKPTLINNPFFTQTLNEFENFDKNFKDNKIKIDIEDIFIPLCNFSVNFNLLSSPLLEFTDSKYKKLFFTNLKTWIQTFAYFRLP